MEKFFGRTYETVGNVSGDLLLKTRGGIKVQIGSSFIDLVKNGKINVDIDIIKEASSKDNIIDNGNPFTSVSKASASAVAILTAEYASLH